MHDLQLYRMPPDTVYERIANARAITFLIVVVFVTTTVYRPVYAGIRRGRTAAAADVIWPTRADRA